MPDSLDPVDIAAEALRPLTVFAYPSHEHVTEMAHTALEALHAAGWRIVRTSTCQCGDPDIEHGDGVHRLDAYPCEERIVKEWSPGVSSVAEAPPAKVLSRVVTTQPVVEGDDLSAAIVTLPPGTRVLVVEDPAGAEATAGLPPEQLLQLQTQAWQEAEPALCADPSCVCHEEGDDSDGE